MFKTDRSPLVSSYVEKRLASASNGYGSYVITRAKAFKALGIELPEYRLLQRRAGQKRKKVRGDFYIRTRCEGEPLADIPANYFQLAGEFGGVDAGEDPQVVMALASLLGDAAAQNLAMKKFDPATRSPLYGVGKEIYRFSYDIKAGRLMPQGVSYCSVRGSLGWPDLARTDRNLEAIASFYLSCYAKSLTDFAFRHPVCPLEKLAEQFLAGFEFRLRAMEWELTVRRDNFDEFNPGLQSRYGFLDKWHFALWALERHVRRIETLRERFLTYVRHPEQAVPAFPGDEEVRVMEENNAANLLSALGDIEIHLIGEN